MTKEKAETPRDAAGEILADVLAVASGDAAAVDETVVVGQPASDHTIVVNQAVSEVSDHTVVVNQAVSERSSESSSDQMAEDRTIVVAQPSSEVSDHTVVVNQSIAESVPEQLAGDHTVVVNQPHVGTSSGQADPGAVDDLVGDGTVVVAAAREETAPRSRRDRREHASADSNPASPVDAPKEKRSLRRIIGGGLDPRRPIAEAPGSLPWEVQPAGERGVAQGLPVSYGARVQTDMPLEVGIDEVQRRVGPAPEASHVAVVQGRDLLPSLQRRDRKRSLITLLAYAGVTVACALGLWGVASIAFGW